MLAAQPTVRTDGSLRAADAAGQARRRRRSLQRREVRRGGGPVERRQGQERQGSSHRGFPGCVSCLREDSEFNLDGPLEPRLPRFTREAYKPPPVGPFIPPFPIAEGTTLTQKRKGRRWQRASPLQALVGAGIAEAFAATLGHYTAQAYFFLTLNPPVHNAPYGLTEDLNDLLLSVVLGAGGLATGMFAFTGLGLVLLAKQNSRYGNNNPPSTSK